MSLLSRLLGRPDKRAEPDLRALWHGIVARARQPRWYAELGAADTIDGRFDMITMIMALVLIRLEGEPDTALPMARLTERFVTDMEGQLREAGIGDVVVGKHMGRMMAALGGRLGSLRLGLESETDEALSDLVTRNMRLADGAAPAPLAQALRALHGELAAISPARLLAGEI